MPATVLESSFTVGGTQVDGRSWVTETHVLSDDTSHDLTYLAEVGTNYAALLSQHAAAINADLAYVPPVEDGAAG